MKVGAVLQFGPPLFTVTVRNRPRTFGPSDVEGVANENKEEGGEGILDLAAHDGLIGRALAVSWQASGFRVACEHALRAVANTGRWLTFASHQSMHQLDYANQARHAR